MTTSAAAQPAPAGSQPAAPANPVSAPLAPPSPVEAAVRVALSLGWTMSDLYDRGLPEQKPGKAGAVHAHLPGLGGLSPSQRALLRLDQIDAAVAALASIIEARNLRLPATSALRTAQGDRALGQEERKARIYALHLNLLRTLTAADFRLGKAYGLGRALADTCRAPQRPEDLKRRFMRARLDNLRGWLNDSASNLPDHSAKAVLAGVVRWEAWVANLGDTAQEWALVQKPIGTTLKRQGELWRAVLTGEKDARDMLSADSYVKAADAMAQRALALMRPLLRRPVVLWPLVALVATAVLLVVWGVASEGAAQLTTGIATAAAALGITWKTVGATAQKLGEALEKPLWGAELDAAAGESLTYLPLVPKPEPRADILLDAPRLLRESYVLPEPSRRRAALSRAMPAGEQAYLHNWAQAAGYVETRLDAGGGEHRQLSHEGERLAEIPPGERGSIRAVLGAGRGIAVGDAPDEHENTPDGAPRESAASAVSDGDEAMPNDNEEAK